MEVTHEQADRSGARLQDLWQDVVDQPGAPTKPRGSPTPGWGGDGTARDDTGGTGWRGGVLTGLEMMRRIDPAAVTDETAIEVLRGAIGARPSEGKPT